MRQLFANNTNSVLASAITASATSITLASGSGAKFPNPGAGDWFLLTLFQMSGGNETNHEIVRCTARAGDVLTILRAQEGTTARAFNSADPVSMRLTAGSLTPAALGAMDAGASPSSLVLLASLTPTVAASIDALNVFSAAYDNYLIIGNGITVGTSDQLCLRLANGGVVDAAANYYTRDMAAGGISSTTSSSQGAVFPNNVLAGGKGVSFSLTLMNANDAANLKVIESRAVGQVLTNPGFLGIGQYTAYTAANPVSGIRLFWLGAANFAASGSIRIYGIKNT
jgi:hypothetical protein